MLARNWPRLCRTISTFNTEMQLSSASSSTITKSPPKRKARSATIDASLASPSPSASPPASTPATPSSSPLNARSLSISVLASSPDTQTNSSSSSDSHSLPLPPRTTHLVPTNTPVYSSPPFHTHHFFLILERTFPTPVARTLTRATHGLLVDRIGKVRREGLAVKDLDNAYLFRAALSELRTESTMRTRNDTAKLQASVAALRREVDALDGKMQEEIQTLKHEIQMEVDSRKNEARTDLKQQDITIEELLNKNIVSLGDLRTEMEKVKWDNMRQAVVYLSLFAIFIVVGMEISGLSNMPKSSPPVQAAHPPWDGKSLGDAGNFGR